ncbi:MAG: T9SS type A sorting domain-containing protein [Bacteroidales bacterium]|nr:T9SS type A sorting domain-containing protein [Bacteroidales bacterium]
MKRLITIFMILLAETVYSQNFRNISSVGLTFFNDSLLNLRGYRYDSVKTIGSDSIYYSFRTIRRNPVPNECSDTNQGPVLSRVILQKPDGTFLFLNMNTDSIRFRTQALLNETWTVCTLPSNKYIEAKVTDIRLDTFLTVTDMVKEMTFTARNQDGTVFPHIINGICVCLSKHYGFVRTVDFNLFPNDTVAWNLAGKSSPEIGIQDFGVAACYDFEPGDIFHNQDIYNDNGSHFESNEIRTILSKTLFGNDSVKYVTEYCGITTLLNWPPTFYRFWDTISETIHFNDPELVDCFIRLPDEFIRLQGFANRYARTMAGINGRITKTCSPDDYEFVQGCWREIYPTGNYYYIENTYTVGLGRTYYYKNVATTGNYLYWKNQLIYYKKNGEEWGIPYSQDCGTLVGLQSKPEVIQMAISVIPNPFIQQAEVIVSGLPAPGILKVSLYDITGRRVSMSEQTENHFHITRNGLVAGLYFLRIVQDQGNATGSIKVLID